MATAIMAGERHVLRSVNEDFCRFAAATRQSLVGQPFADVLPWLAAEGIGAMLERVYRTGEAIVLADLEREDPVLGVRFYTHTASPWLDDQGRPRGVSLLVIETTEEVLARRHCERIAAEMREVNERLVMAGARERELALEAEAARRRLQAILDNATAVVYAKDPAGRYVLTNRQFETLFHVRREDVVGKTDYQLFPAEVADAFRANDLEVLKSAAPLTFEETAPQDDGSHTYVSVKFPLFDANGAIVATCGISTDISERKRAEEERAELLARQQDARADAEASRRRAAFLTEVSALLAESFDYEVTLASVAHLVLRELADWCIIDLQEGDEFVHRVALVHKRPEHEWVARALRECYAPDPARSHPVVEAGHTRRSELVAEVDEAWLEARARDAEHLRLLRAMEMTSAIITPLIVGGRLLGTLSLALARPGRHYEAADVVLAEQLAQRAAVAIDNARLYRAAQEATRQAEAAVQARDDFLARASHELRTPLTSALGTVRLLKRAIEGTVRAHRDELIDIASRNLSAMLALINDLLDASKLTRGSEPLELESIDLSGVVESSAHVIGVQAREKGVSLRVDMPSGARIRGDHLKLEQVFVNLLSNAVKFTPACGEISVVGTLEEAAALVRVRDSGRGIAREHLERVFEPFFQIADRGPRAAADRRSRPRGAGLGLAISHQIIALHGGRIWAESEGPGRGSTFTVRLPISAAAGEAA